MERLRVDTDETAAVAKYQKAGARIRDGRLVAFPTETVYGLGANGLDASAVKRLFEAKRRPASDPVILHVLDADEALRLFELSEEETAIVSRLQAEFWPGPLTIVAKAAAHVPAEVMANSGFVSCRSPQHPVARHLIAAAGRPIAGPSANLFSRISPTKAEHVAKYFSDDDVLLLECDDACGVGIESSVVKVHLDSEHKVAIQVLRAGAITADMLRQICPGLNVEYRTTFKSVVDDKSSSRAPQQRSDAPGQCLTHYSPSNVPSYLAIRRDSSQASPGIPIVTAEQLASACVVDLGTKTQAIAQSARSYLRVSSGNSLEELAASLFEAMHRAEKMAEKDQGVKLILFVVDECIVHIDAAQGLLDRLVRAAGQKILQLPSI